MLAPLGQERFVWGFVTAPETRCLLDKKTSKTSIWPIEGQKNTMAVANGGGGGGGARGAVAPPAKKITIEEY